MDYLCFGTFAKTLQSAMQKPNSNQAAAGLLLDFVAGEANGSELSADFSVRPKMVSGLMNFTDNVHEDIVSLSATVKVIDAMPDKFKRQAVLVPALVDDLIANLCGIINADKSISAAKRDELTAMADKEHLAGFLSQAYLYALNKPNKAAAGRTDTKTAEELVPLDDLAKLHKIYAKYPRPKDLAMPTEPAEEELAYIAELLAAYAEAEGISSLPRAALCGYARYSGDLRQRRKEYYAAETIRRGTREVFKENDSGQFDLLKEETSDGIFDVHSQTYQHGYERLLCVMTQVSAIQINKSPLSRLPEWIGNKEKKGVCHILVNDGRIKWAVRDE